MDECLYHAFYLHEERHWWFAARMQIVRRALEHYAGLTSGSTILDVGCGTGAVLKSLADRYNVIGIDTSPLAVDYCHRRGLDTVFQASAEDLLDRETTVDALLLLDVIEHIDDDVGVLKTASRLVRPGGKVLITVPAHPWMWSAHDVVNQHRRRYTKQALRTAIAQSGLELTELRYFNSFLFPLVAGAKIASRVGRSHTAHVSPAEHLGVGNDLLTRVFAAEKHLIPHVALPFGVSLMAVARSFNS